MSIPLHNSLPIAYYFSWIRFAYIDKDRTVLSWAGPKEDTFLWRAEVQREQSLQEEQQHKMELELLVVDAGP